MQKNPIQQVKDLSQRALVYQKQGNFDYSKKCYSKIVLILKQVLKNTSDERHLLLLQQKIKKYIQEGRRVGELQNNRNTFTNVSKMGFPTMVDNNNHQNVQQLLNQTKNNYQNLMTNTKNVKKNNPMNIEVDSDIQGMIVRNIKLTFNDIVGMNEIKDIIQEAVIRPRKRPDLFTGIRAPPRGILFYGPPGNGKTYFAKALANEAQCTFFSVSASAIMNKFVGQSQKMLKKLFMTAEQLSPSIIFIDQIDSLLTARSQKQNESARRVKTQFLILMDGMMSAKQGDVLLIGATNLPKQLDLAVLRRFNKLIYIGLPDVQARQGIILHNLKEIPYDLSKNDMKILTTKMLEGYTASQVKDIVKEVSMLPIRDIQKSQFEMISLQKIRKIVLKDFETVLKKKKPLLTKEDLQKYNENFNQ